MLRKAMLLSRVKGGMDMWVARTDGGGSMVPTDYLMKATSRVQDMYVKKFRTSVHRAFGPNT